MEFLTGTGTISRALLFWLGLAYRHEGVGAAHATWWPGGATASSRGGRSREPGRFAERGLRGLLEGEIGDLPRIPNRLTRTLRHRSSRFLLIRALTMLRCRPMRLLARRAPSDMEQRKLEPERRTAVVAHGLCHLPASPIWSRRHDQFQISRAAGSASSSGTAQRR
jgi:hypothetical protein